MDEINKKLCIAIENEDFEAVKDSIYKGGQLYARIDYRKLFMPWSWLYSCNSIPILSTLLNQNGCNVNYPIQELEDQTIIFGAVLDCNSEKIKVLVANGANINAIDNMNHTPLSFALTFKDDESMNLVPLLLGLGADVSIGNNPFEVIEKNHSGGSVKMKRFCEYLVEFLDRIKNEKTLKDLKLAFSRIKESIRGHNNVLDILTEELDDIELMFSFEEKAKEKAHSEIQQLLESWSRTAFGESEPTKVKEEEIGTFVEEEKARSEDQQKQTKSEQFNENKGLDVILEKIVRLENSFSDQSPHFNQPSSQDNSKKIYHSKTLFSSASTKKRITSNTIKWKDDDYHLVFETLTREYDLDDGKKGMIKLSDLPFEGPLFENTIEEFGDIFFFHLFGEMINHPNSAFSKDWVTFLKHSQFSKEETPYLYAAKVFIEKYSSMFPTGESSSGKALSYYILFEKIEFNEL